MRKARINTQNNILEMPGKRSKPSPWGIRRPNRLCLEKNTVGLFSAGRKL